MCAIFGVFNIQGQDGVMDLRDTVIKQVRLMRHRGPDWSGIYTHNNAILAHERLAIVDINTGAQPLYSDNGEQILAVNGEIYNHLDIKKQSFADYGFTTDSDCEVILPLYQRGGVDFLNQLEGMFAFALYDEAKDEYLIARDPIGIIPLYYGYDDMGHLFVASEMKALAEVCRKVSVFPPGHYLDSKHSSPQPYYQPAWQEYSTVENAETHVDQLQESLEQAVCSHMMSDVPYGVLLSGGLDSSLIAALACQFAARRVEDQGRSPAWWPQVHSFSIGLEGSPDLIAAEKVANHLDTVHHGFTFTLQEGLDALRDVIWHLETYDVTTIRASTPMYLMARKIRAMGIKMVLSGEGADEIFGGYLYFHKAPDAQSFHEETVRKLHRLHHYDCLRANKAMSAWGVEARVPFLDRGFLDVAMSLNPEDKMIQSGRMEKHLLRSAFEGLLPDDILWRQKEQFSDGVGYSWIDGLKDHAEKRVTDHKLAAASHRFPLNTPTSKEAYYYRSLFEERFAAQTLAETVPWGPSVACSSPEAMAWDSSFNSLNDPSGRAVRGVHQSAYQ